MYRCAVAKVQGNRRFFTGHLCQSPRRIVSMYRTLPRAWLIIHDNVAKNAAANEVVGTFVVYGQMTRC